MSAQSLSNVIRDEADRLDEEATAADKHDQQTHKRLFQDGAELLRVLARLLEGKDLHKAFGAPGDWGYGRRIGDALLKAYRDGHGNEVLAKPTGSAS